MLLPSNACRVLPSARILLAFPLHLVSPRAEKCKTANYSPPPPPPPPPPTPPPPPPPPLPGKTPWTRRKVLGHLSNFLAHRTTHHSAFLAGGQIANPVQEFPARARTMGFEFRIPRGGSVY